MIQFKPFLIVRKMVITKGKRRVYDETFSEGVNIIRGKNSSGKSTIADFIFYGLGGDLTKLKEEAKACDYVYIEASLSGKIFTLRREVKEGGRKGMDIFPGLEVNAIKAPASDWTRYPYSADTKESFYQVIFKEMGIPYSKSDDKSSLTMHQLLRMMYVDQMTSPDRLFKFDRFDSPNKRKAIGELLLGVSDFSLFEKRVLQQRLASMLDSRIKDIKTIHAFLGGTIKTVAEIEQEILSLLRSINTLEEELSALYGAYRDESGAERTSVNALAKEIRLKREHLSSTKEELAITDFEIDDSSRFIDSLKGRLLSLLETKDTIAMLSDITFHHCPACMKAVPERTSGCSLCGSDIEAEADEVDPTFRVRKEIEFQIAESLKLIEAREKRARDLNVRISEMEAELSSMELEFSSIVEPQKVVSISVRKKISEIGALNNQIKELNASKEKFSKLYALYEERNSIQSECDSINDEIFNMEKRIENEMNRKTLSLSNSTIEILHADKDHEEIFNEGEVVSFDFSEDRVMIDDRAIFSASSMVYLKNAFRLALLKCSCDDRSYMYPRFLLMDNVEDKGMESERSHVFQREIVKLSRNLKVEHQIIFTTSMIAPDLEGTNLCVGEYYSDKNKSLKL